RLPSEQDVKDYDPNSGPCCTTHNFRPDLTATPGTPWNKSAIGVFVEAYMEEGTVKCDDPDIIEAYFKRHLQYLIYQFKHTSDSEEVKKARKCTHRRQERRRGLFHRRLETAQNNADLKGHVYMLQRLGPEGMSSDESEVENGVKVYKVLVKKWRNPDLVEWFKVFDSIARMERTNVINGMDGRGAPYRERIRSTKDDDKCSPVGRLPPNAYNSTWFDDLNKFSQARINVLKKAYSFTHTDAAKTWVSRRCL
ncbi:hypothetical protein L226DRAFT_449638, partial [Lentinus tigrinus ALCF2SS1-7]|uniref:uncharacterized protein n=1 Tax=Lentinus tigrinus ALCF2SS1-7 TaxID=1328758 RepID=UPI001165F375